MSTDDIGERGQWIFAILMTELCGRNEPYFRPRFIADKFPTFDYIVELADHPAFYFFAQVKATREGYSKNAQRRLKVRVTQKDIDRMVACPAPTYVIGIDEPAQVGFLLSVNEPRDRVASLITRFQIDCNVLRELYDEVATYWRSRSMQLTASRFRE